MKVYHLSIVNIFGCKALNYASSNGILYLTSNGVLQAKGDRSVRERARALHVCDKCPGGVCLVLTNTVKDNIPRRGIRQLGDRAICGHRF